MQIELVDALYDMSKSGYHQILLTTHNPALARLLPQNAFRYIQATDEGRRVVSIGEEALERTSTDLGFAAFS